MKIDIAAAEALVRDWPTPIVFSGFEIGIAVPYPAASIEQDFAYVPIIRSPKLTSFTTTCRTIDQLGI